MRITKPLVLGTLLVGALSVPLIASVTPTGVPAATITPAPQSPSVPAQVGAPAPIQEGFGAGAYRPGGGVVWPRDTLTVKPIYTDEARSRRIEGIVELEALVLRDGTVGPVRITKSLDAQFGLDNEAIRAARQWLFKPAQLNGESVPAVVPFQLEFRSPTPGTPSPGDVAGLRPLADDFAKDAYVALGDDNVAPQILGPSKYTPDQMRVKLTERRNSRIIAPRETRIVYPVYTTEGLRAKIEGPVDIEVIVMPDGTVGKARVVRSLDMTYGLDDQALAAARQWTFIPGTLDGKPVPVLGTISLRFHIRK